MDDSLIQENSNNYSINNEIEANMVTSNFLRHQIQGAVIYNMNDSLETI